MAVETTAPAIPAGIRRDTIYLPEVESMRGLAILLVVAFHGDGLMLFPFADRVGSSPPLPLAYLYGGHTGVTLFFVLSAFLLALPFLRETYGGRPVARGQFYARRALRILPLYYCAVAVAALLTSELFADLWRALPYLFFAESKPNAVTPMMPWSGVWWSLATEVQFYLLLPIGAAVLFGRSRALTVGLLVLYALAHVGLALGWVVPWLEPWLRAQSVLGRGPVFVCGILAAWFWLRHGDRLRSRLAAIPWVSGGGGDLLLLLVLMVLGLLLRWTTAYEFVPLETSWRYLWHVPEGVLWTMVVLIVLLAPLRAKVLFSNPLLARLGVLSYSLYVLHFPVLHYSLSGWRSLFPHAGIGWTPLLTAWFVLAVALCVGLSVLTYRWIERPFLMRKARLDTGTPVPSARAA